MIKILDYSSLEMASMLLYNNISFCWELIDYNKRNLWKTINTKKRVNNQVITPKSASNLRCLPIKEDKNCSTLTVKKSISFKSCSTRPTPPPVSAEWRRPDKSPSLPKTKNWPWCQKPSRRPTRDYCKTTTQQPETTILTSTSLPKSMKREIKIPRNTGSREAKKSSHSSQRSIKWLPRLKKYHRSMRSRELKNSLRDLPKLEKRPNGRKWWLREATLVLLGVSRRPGRTSKRCRMTQPSTLHQWILRSSPQDLEELTALRSCHQETSSS